MGVLDRYTPDIRVRRAEPDEDGKYEGEDEYKMLFVEFDIEDQEVHVRTDEEVLQDYFHPALMDLSRNLGELESIEVRPSPRQHCQTITTWSFRQHRLPFLCSAWYSMGKRMTTIRFELLLRETN
jgi:hypothetical protein